MRFNLSENAPIVKLLGNVMTKENINRSACPEAAKFLDWYSKERSQRGLIDLKFYPGNTSESTLEEFFGEVNAALAAPVVADDRVF